MLWWPLPLLLLILQPCNCLDEKTKYSSTIEDGTDRVEAYRLEQYANRNYSWPIESYTPETPGWRTLMDKRFAQVERIEEKERRYEAYIQTLNSALLVPNYTETGHGFGRCPDELLAALQTGIQDGLPGAQEERRSVAIPAPEPPLFIYRPHLVSQVLEEMQPFAEAWSGQRLTPAAAYGFRLYRNESQLYMHLDKVQTHVISVILHIASSDDAEPWPLVIEDYTGVTNQIVLSPGDILFYESAKCLHGRPKPFRGSWYTSVFVHYFPMNTGWDERNHLFESHCAVPPHWTRQPPVDLQQKFPRIEMVGTSMREPDCPNDWCFA